MAIAHQLTRQGHDVTVVTALPSHPRGKVFEVYRRRILIRERIQAIRVVRTWVLATGTSVRSRLLTYVTFAASSLLGHFAAMRPDVVLVETPPVFAGVSGWLIAKFSNARLIVYVADLWAESAGELGIVKNPILLGLANRLERFVVMRADVISVPTEGVRAAVERKGISRDRIVLLPNGVDESLFQPTPPDPKWSARIGAGTRPLFAYIGNHGYVHGLDVLIEAARIASEVSVLLMGEGSDKPRLMELVRRTGPTNVIFIDAEPLEEIPRVLSICRAALASVRDEPILRVVRSAKIFPALACARAIIYCGDDEGSEIVRHAGCGIVVPPGNAALLAEAMSTLARRPDIAAEMGARGRQLVEARYTWDLLVRRWLDELADRLPVLTR